jgi:adenosylcobinamide-GDP ribazoletransferase
MALAPLAALPLAVAGALTVWLADALLAPPLLAAALTVAVLALGSGGLHLDGLADTVDGLAVPGDRDRRLEVMRRGDVGPAGAAALVLVLLVQVAALAAVLADRDGTTAALSTGAAVVVSRVAVPITCAAGVPAARRDGLGSPVAGTVPRLVVLALLVAAAALAWVADGVHGVAATAVAAAVVGVLLLRAGRRIGGISGDVIGAGVELALAGYLVALTLTLPL